MNKISISAHLAIACMVICLSAQAHGAEHRYTAQSNRDPFIPLITGELKTSMGLEYVETIDDIKLEGIIFDPSATSLAILNGEVMKEGDVMFNVELVEIHGKGVIIKIYNKPYTVSLLEEGGE